MRQTTRRSRNAPPGKDSKLNKHDGWKRNYVDAPRAPEVLYQERGKRETLSFAQGIEGTEEFRPRTYSAVR